MVIVRKTGGKGGEPLPTPKPPIQKKPAAAAVSSGSELKLSTELSIPASELGDFSWLLYGEKKVGKTSLAARFPDAAFFFFEPGGKGLRVHPHPCPDWKTFLGYVRLLKAHSDFKTVIIDTADIAYEKCFAYVAKKEGFEHPTDENDFGKSWKKIKDEFTNAMDEIIATGRGIVFISHADEKEFQLRGGTKYTKIVPSIPKQAREYLRGFCDIIAYYGYYGDDRLLTIQGSENLDAGHRVEEHFITTKGEHVHSIPMGESPDDGYKNINIAFDNQQTEPHQPRKAAALGEMPVIRKGRG